MVVIRHITYCYCYQNSKGANTLRMEDEDMKAIAECAINYYSEKSFQ